MPQVTNAPVIGKVAQTGAERVLGSALGGVIGYLVYECGSQIWKEDSNLDGVCHMLLQFAAPSLLVAPAAAVILRYRASPLSELHKQ